MRGRWTIVLVAVCLGATVAAIAYGAGKDAAPEVIQAQRFELVDAAGTVLAMLGPNPGGGGTLVLRNKRGKLCTELSATRGGGLTLHNEEGRLRAVLSVDADGEPRLELFDNEVNVIWRAPEPQATLGPSEKEQTPGKWREVASWSGKSTRSTEKFTVGSPWKIMWDTRPGDLGAMNFQIFIYGEDGVPGLAANVIGADQDQSIQHKAGTYYLQFNTAQRYTVRVLELR